MLKIFWGLVVTAVVAVVAVLALPPEYRWLVAPAVVCVLIACCGLFFAEVRERKEKTGSGSTRELVALPPSASSHSEKATQQQPKAGIKTVFVDADNSQFFHSLTLGSRQMECKKCGEVFIAARSMLNAARLSFPGVIETVTCPGCGMVQAYPKDF